MTTEHIEGEIARYVAHPAQPSHEAMTQAELLLLDYLAIAAAGASRDSARAARTAEADGRPGTALLEGTREHTDAEHAAFVNGVSAHGLEIDDTHEESSSHPGTVIWPALAAVADSLSESPSIDEVLRAGIVGYDVMCAVGAMASAASIYGRGFHPTGVLGALGSAAAVSALLGFDESTAARALALAANSAAGSLEFLSDGSWTKRMNAGLAAAAGIRACRLARAGFTGPSAWLTGRDGFLLQYATGASEDRVFAIRPGSGVMATSIKLYPCCRYMHGVLDLLIDVRAEVGSIDVDELLRVDVAVIETGQHLVSLPPEDKIVIKTPVNAQFSMPFGAAVALAEGAVTLADFDNAPVLAEELAGWLPKVVTVTNRRVEAAYPTTWEAAVDVFFADGTAIHRYSTAYRGSPGAPAGRDVIVDKAVNLVGDDARILDAHLRGDLTSSAWNTLPRLEGRV